jgi:serine/threonine protein kinase
LLFKRLLSHISYLHVRDLKLSNLLYDREKGTLKIADFGLCRKISDPSFSDKMEKSLPLTPKVVSLWYRPPELLLGSDTYSFSIDIWGAACVIGEFILGVPMFNGKTEMGTLQKIIDLLGPPTFLSWPQMREMPLINDKHSEIQSILESKRRERRYTSSTLMDKFGDLSPSGINLLRCLLQYDPTLRWTAKKAAGCKWFQEEPLPTNEAHMPSFANKKIP